MKEQVEDIIIEEKEVIIDEIVKAKGLRGKVFRLICTR